MLAAYPFRSLTSPLLEPLRGKGGDYGHHMCRAACNIGGVLLSEELKKQGIAVLMLHPGFNRTGMTSKYSAIWDIEGAVEASVGAKRVLHEVKGATMERTGKFIVRETRRCHAPCAISLIWSHVCVCVRVCVLVLARFAELRGRPPDPVVGLVNMGMSESPRAAAA